MKKTFLTLVIIYMMAMLPCNSKAGNLSDSLQMRARVGYNVGGTAPIGIPATIRSIDAFRLTPSFMAGVDLMLPLSSRWGVAVGVRFENKAMDAGVTTKGYRMELVKGDSKIEGLFTGHVQQKVTQWMLTVPLEATFTFNRKFSLKAGPYVSMLTSSKFSGIASGGYLRQGDPTGAKIIIGEKEGEWATYDFSDEMRHVQYGVSAGADWQAFRQIGISAELHWGFIGVLHSDFKTVEQTLYPIYGTISMYYKIK